MMADMRLIDANALMKKIAHHTVHDSLKRITFEAANTYEQVKGDMFALVQKAPVVDAAPVVHGRWVHDDLGHTYCSKCHERIPYIHCYSDEPCSDYDEEWDEEMPESLFCPNCGAKMDGGASDV